MIVAICEGDTEQLEELCTYVSQLPDVEQLCFSSGRALLKAIRAGKQFDMILLSIELPDKNGTEIARILRACQPNMDIILISSCPKYVTQAFSLQVSQFFLKPISERLFLKEMERLMKRRKLEKKSWCVHTKSAIYRLSPAEIPAEIIYIKTIGRHLMIQTIERQIEIPGRLAVVEKELEEYGFVRCHQGFLVNLQHVQAVEENEVRCSFGNRVPVSNRMHQRFLETLEQYRA